MPYPLPFTSVNGYEAVKKNGVMMVIIHTHRLKPTAKDKALIKVVS
jgi:hypothetical protein